MGKVFRPEKSIFIPASAPHPANTEYKCSIGKEDWGGFYQEVIKVQMVYDGLIAGRRSPSYPFGTDDYDRVHKAVLSLINAGEENTKKNQ
jgi:hypothetical protein